MRPQKRHNWHKLAWISVALVCAGLYGAVYYRQSISDWWTLRDYTPPAAIEEVADNIALTDAGRRLFYVQDPVFLEGSAFNDECSIYEATIILGCFSERDGIFLLQVDDPRLNGIHEVTAAHEILHAVYERMSTGERERIDQQLQDYFANELANERVRQTVEAYRERDPSVVPNELHSILGTEVRGLPTNLENHYAQYFTDRNVVVGFSESYEEAFTSIEQEIANFDAQLDTLNTRIEQGTAQLDAQQASLSNQRSQLDALLENNNVQAYNAAVPGFNQQVNSFNALVASVQRDIDEFNRIVQLRNAVAREQRSLIDAIDSRAF